MNLESLFYTCIGLMFNAIISYSVFKVINYISNDPVFRKWVKTGIEDGDDTLNRKDIVGTLLMFFGFMFFWLLLDMLIGSLIFKRDMISLLASVFTMAGSLLGIGTLVKK